MSDTDEKLARHRRTIRAASGLSQDEVVERAKAAGYSLSVDTLATAEAGRSITERSLRAICIGLDCKLAHYVTTGSPVVVD